MNEIEPPRKHFWRFLLHDLRLLWAIYALAAIGVSFQKWSQGRGTGGYTAYENYLIFKNSYAHLLSGANPYAAFPAEQWDLFKYSPAFALCMAPFSHLPDWLGLCLWNLLNALPLLAAVLFLPVLDAPKRRFMAWVVLPELVISMQNSQSNGLTAALILLTFNAFERGQIARAALFAATSGFIKIFGIFAALLCLFYPKKGRFVALLGLWCAVFALGPGLFIGPQQLAQVYRWWADLLANDHDVSIGYSVMGWLQTWFGLAPPKTWVTMAGLALLLGSFWVASGMFVRFLQTKSGAPLQKASLSLASLLIWVVIFNHKAESPTFIIAMCGAALWFLSGEQKLWERALFWTAFAFSSLSPTDIFPKILRESLVQPFVLKAVPCIVIWFLITYKLMRGGPKAPIRN